MHFSVCLCNHSGCVCRIQGTALPHMKDTLRIHAADGYPLSVTSYIPRSSNGHVILINSATGVKQKFYGDFATHLALQGFRVFTYDYRGIGNSKPSTLKNFGASMHEWGTLDYHAVLKYVFLTYTDCETTVIGHSVGGQIIGMSPLSENVDRFVMIGAQTPYVKNFGGGFNKIKLLFFWYLLIPVLTRLFGYFPASRLGLFEDLPEGVAGQWADWARSKNFLFDELPFMKQRFNGLRQDSLMISFADDTYAPEGAVKDLMGHYKNMDWSHWHLTPNDLGQRSVGHFSVFKSSVGFHTWNQLMSWIGSSPELQKVQAA
jgi:predicted alpha/beta hydrolase